MIKRMRSNGVGYFHRRPISSHIFEASTLRDDTSCRLVAGFVTPAYSSWCPVRCIFPVEAAQGEI